MHEKFLSYMVAVFLQVGTTAVIVPSIIAIKKNLNGDARFFAVKLIQIGIFLIISGLGIWWLR